MTYFSTLTPINPIAHTEVAPAPQPTVAPVSAPNYIGGAGILTMLAVMVAAGLSAAGMTKTTRRAKYINPQTAAVMAAARLSCGWDDQV